MKTTRLFVVCGVALLLVASCSAPPKPAQTEPEPAGAAAPEEAPASTSPSVATTRAMYVNVDVANVRREPSRVADILGKVRRGEEVVAVGEPELEWQKVIFGEAGTEAWVHASLLSATVDETVKAEEAAAETPAASTPPPPPVGTAIEAAPSESFGDEPIPEESPSADGPIKIGTPADTVLAIRGAADSEKITGSDANGSIVEWKYKDVTYIMKRWMENGVECYRVAEIR